MAAPHLADVSKIGHDVLKTTQSQKTGLVTAQTGDVVAGVATADESEWYYPPGLVSRVRVPDAGQKAAQIVAITRGDHDAIVGCRDERIQDIIGQLDDGETAVFAPAKGGGVCFFRNDGSIDVKAGAGSASVKIGTDGSVKIGGASPVALARGDALGQLISIMTTFCAGNAVSLGSPLSTSAAAIKALEALTTIQTVDTTAT